MFENIGNFFKKMMKSEQKELPVDTNSASKDAAKERLHIVLMQDRANVSADFLELMKQEIIDVIKKYIVIDEDQIDVRLTNQENEDGTTGAPSLYANIPILNIRNDIKGEVLSQTDKSQTATVEEEKQSPDEEIEKSNIEKNEDVIIENKLNEDEINKENISKNLVNENSSEDLINSIDNLEEDDDDVTFDDLLKAAEEEEKKEAEEKAKKETIKPKSVRKKVAGRKPSAKKKSSSSKSKKKN